jgi:hypothetical protein
MAAGTDGTELHRLTNASELGPATPQRANMAALLASAQRSNEASSERTRTLLDQLSAANQTLAAQNTVYRAEKSPWSAAQAATRLAAAVSPRAPSEVDKALAAAAPAPRSAQLPEAVPGRQRRETTLSIKNSPPVEDVALKLFVVVEQAENLPVMDLLSSDPYLKVWHQESTPPQQPASHADLAQDGGRLPCLPSSATPPVAFKSTSLTHLGQSSVIRESLNPIWQFRVEHDITLRPGQLLEKGWLVVEVWDYDRVGDDDPMGRIDIALEECQEDVVIDKWYKLGWVPGQTHPGPGEQSRVKVRLLLSSLPRGLPRPKQWMLKSYDFVELQEMITAYQHTVEHEEEETEDRVSRAVMSRCEWHLYEIVNEAFSTFDVDGDGLIQPAELMHVMGVLGEEMDFEELAEMVVECKTWAQPDASGGIRNGQPAHSSASSKQQMFSPVSVRSLDFSREKSGQSEACINATEFRNMLTEYWVSRKYGSKLYGAVHDVKFRKKDKWGLKDQDGASSSTEYIELSSALDHASAHMPPVPGWMADIAAGHNRMSDDKRVPEMFWFFLRRKMEQVLLRANKTGVKEVGFFRRDSAGLSDKSSLGYTVRNTESRFSACWDLLQVVLLSYVSVAVPYQTGFDVSADTGSGLWWWELFVDLYFVPAPVNIDATVPRFQIGIGRPVPLYRGKKQLGRGRNRLCDF